VNDVEVISQHEPTARKEHICNLCTGPIKPGQRYERQVCKRDHVYTWKTCAHCLSDEIPAVTAAWSYGESVDYETATEWALDARRYSHDYYEQLAARRFLERSKTND